ncbi:PaaI family thioesterase [Novosphingobium cyanobacteriorum]|uniref:PaaI family thioesterase n=1 Tax=Novosphingobium cyanobacteriorum TaxID=3024215 RepID=A0ABT6CGM4_9SPHN|nr:PaaI family thioesterase [Novosphingobium cyanobacteriorum]MDF8332235.1 PaaI family thioesterase [Novosphingobium cyanobacteriorum]
MGEPKTGFVFEPAPHAPGWHTWNLADDSRFNGQTLGSTLVRLEELPGGKQCLRLRMNAERRHSNVMDAVHGGVTLALIDVSLFAGFRFLLDGDAAGAVTLDLSTQFIGAGKIGQPMDAVVEVLRETRRLVFLRGIVEQDDTMVAAFSGTIRKPSAS